jgi:alpha-galactosidase
MADAAIEVLPAAGPGPVFHVSTRRTSLVMRVGRFGHLEQVHYGPPVTGLDTHGIDSLLVKPTPTGMAVAYSAEDEAYSLDAVPLAWSSIGKGDFREPPMEVRMPDGTVVADLTYRAHEVLAGPLPPQDGLPGALDPTGLAATLVLTLVDLVGGVELDVVVTAYPDSDVITRRAVLRNVGGSVVTIRALMSMMLDLPDLGFDLVTFDGSWIAEAHEHRRPLGPGLTVNASSTGDSSSRHNPGVLLVEHRATEEHGAAFGFNLVYSGNHRTGVDRTTYGQVRVTSGINPVGLEWVLAPGQRFETPEAVMTFSGSGVGGVSANFHGFVGRHVVRGEWADRERPVKLNTWESTFFDVADRPLRSMAKAAADLGVELFVLDDGWFGDRDDDHRGLGDWVVNPGKFPHGLRPLAEEVESLGMTFGLWFEPECVNEDSDLFRAHPDWALRVPGRVASPSRHQLTLDLSRADVRDHLVEAIGAVLDDAPIGYVKWDMNRHLSDVGSAVTPPGELVHRHILGLYDVLGRVFGPRPHILLESCSSGGNRFDLGMLCFSPQIWASDDTDPIERLDIQLGLARLYPPSTTGAHVSASPHQQTLRATPLSTRFNVAALGVLGYELDPRDLNAGERREVRDQIAFYKEHRRTLQFGRWHRSDPVKEHQVDVTVVAPDASSAIHGHYQLRARADDRGDRLPVRGLDPGRHYRMGTRPQGLDLTAFGGLLKHVLPRQINPTGKIIGTAARHYRLPDAVEEYAATGATLMAGVVPVEQFIGTGYTKETRMLGDGGSTLYVIEDLDPAGAGSREKGETR